MKLTPKDLQRFLTEDTFYHFVARKHGCFIKNEDDLSEVRCKAILGVMRRYNEEYEFEDEKHIFSFTTLEQFKEKTILISTLFLIPLMLIIHYRIHIHTIFN